MVKYPQKPLNSKELNLHRTLQSSSSGVIVTNWGKPDQTSSSSTGHARFPKRVTSAALPPLPFQRNHSDCTKNRIPVVETETAAAESAGRHSLTTTQRCFPGERPGGYSGEPVGGAAELRRARSETNDVRMSLHHRVWGSGLAKFKPVLNLHF